MSSTDDEKAVAGAASDPHPWLSALPAVLTVAGVVLFGLLNVAYSVFYDRLGVAPETVGLDYATTLTRSTGLLALLAVAAILGARVYVRRRLMRQLEANAAKLRTAELRDAGEAARQSGDAVAAMAASLQQQQEAHAAEQRRMAEESNNPAIKERAARMAETFERNAAVVRQSAQASAEAQSGGSRVIEATLTVASAVDAVKRERRVRRGLLTVAVAGLVLLALTPVVVDSKVDDVRRGEAVEPIGVLGLTILDIRARPAQVRSAGAPGKASAVADLERRPLLYLGQSSNTIVLFDPRADRAAQVPAAASVLTIEPPD